MKTPDYSRIAKSIRRCFAKFDHVRAIHERMLQLLQYECGNDEPENLLIVGDPGVGKSSLLQRFWRDYPRIEHETWTEVPVLYVQVPAKCSLVRLPGAMLYELGSPLWNKGDEEERTFQLLTLLLKCRVRLVILDELNHIVDRGKERTHYLLADWIKQLSDKSGISFVMSGIERVRVLFQVNEQLADRAPEVITIEPFGASENCPNKMAVALKAFAGLLSDIDKIDITKASTAQMFAFATAGRLRGVRRLLVRSVELTSKKDRPMLDHPVLAEAFRQVVFPGASDERNPFVPAKFNGQPLTKPGEPYVPRRQTKEEVDV